jgi:Ran GTPase-activating protein (RanGAP) involved in mRNA processing and transport
MANLIHNDMDNRISKEDTKEIRIRNECIFRNEAMIHFSKQECIKILIDHIKYNTRLESINISGFEFKFGIQLMFNHIAMNNTVVKLRLNLIFNLTDSGVESLCSALKTNNTIRELDLSHNNLTHKSTFMLSKLLEYKHNITSLNLDHNNIRNDGLYYLSRSTHHIKKLSLGNNNIKIKSMLSIYDGISNFINISNIEHLNLCTCHLNDKDIKILCHNLIIAKTAGHKNQHHRISTLNLGSNKLTIKSLSYIAYLLDNSNLSDLNISFNNFSCGNKNIVIEYDRLLQAIAQSDTITSLNMEYCRINNRYIDFFY